MANRLRVGEALERALTDRDGKVSGRVTFQLEYVWNTKTMADGSTKRFGPYGPYWYVYWYVPRGVLRPSYLKRVRSRYLGKPGSKRDPRNLTARQLARLIK